MIFIRRLFHGLAVVLVVSHIYVTKAMAANQSEFVLTTEVSSQDFSWKISPQVSSPVEQVLRYEITTEKTGQSGRSQTHQSGQVKAFPHHPTTLATVNLGLNPEDNCTVSVQVFVGVDLVAEERIRLPR